MENREKRSTESLLAIEANNKALHGVVEDLMKLDDQLASLANRINATDFYRNIPDSNIEFLNSIAQGKAEVNDADTPVTLEPKGLIGDLQIMAKQANATFGDIGNRIAEINKVLAYIETQV